MLAKFLIKGDVVVGKDWAKKGISESLSDAWLNTKDAIARSNGGWNEWSLRDFLKRSNWASFENHRAKMSSVGFMEASRAITL